MTSNLSLSEQLVLSTVRIECETPFGSVTGTGFFYRFSMPQGDSFPVVITNRHVVKDAFKGHLCLSFKATTGGLPSEHQFFELDDFQNQCYYFPDPSVDLCAISVGEIVKQSNDKGKRFASIFLDHKCLPTEDDLKQLMAVEDVIMIGYPNGIWDSVNNLPIIRKGITATHPNADYLGDKIFMIDAACFPGSSGSPVFLYNFGFFPNKQAHILLGTRLKLLGILYAGPYSTTKGKIIDPTKNVGDAYVLTKLPNNLGLAIKAERIKEFEDYLKTVVPI